MICMHSEEGGSLRFRVLSSKTHYYGGNNFFRSLPRKEGGVLAAEEGGEGANQTSLPQRCF